MSSVRTERDVVRWASPILVGPPRLEVVPQADGMKIR